MKNTYIDLFLIFAKIGAFTIGGGYAMIPLIEAELVNRKKWINKEEFADIIAISQSAPGLIAVNVSIFLGYRLKGVRGSITATLGSVLPSFLIILAIAMLFKDYSENPAINAMFKGIRPVVVALIAVPAVNMLKTFDLNYLSIIIVIVTILLISVAGISPVYVILAAIAVSVAHSVALTAKKRKRQ